MGAGLGERPRPVVAIKVQLRHAKWGRESRVYCPCSHFRSRLLVFLIGPPSLPPSRISSSAIGTSPVCGELCRVGAGRARAGALQLLWSQVRMLLVGSMPRFAYSRPKNCGIMHSTFHPPPYRFRILGKCNSKKEGMGNTAISAARIKQTLFCGRKTIPERPRLSHFRLPSLPLPSFLTPR